MSNLKEISDKTPWEEFLKKIPHTPFLQSFACGQFQEKIGNEVYRFGVFEKDKLVGLCCAIKTKAKFNSFLYVPWGPVFQNWEKGSVKAISSKVLDIAKKENLDFV